MIRSTSITTARSSADIRDVAGLFLEYEKAIDIDLSYQDFVAEVAGLPGTYAPPRGELLLARINIEPVGCVAVRPLEEERCELKRLFVAPQGRGRGIGKQLLASIAEEARRLGYSEMYLDTLPSLTSAIALYHAVGFEETDAYNSPPNDELLFFRKYLR